MSTTPEAVSSDALFDKFVDSQADGQMKAHTLRYIDQILARPMPAGDMAVLYVELRRRHAAVIEELDGVLRKGRRQSHAEADEIALRRGYKA